MSFDMDTTAKSGTKVAGTFASGLTGWPTNAQLGGGMTDAREGRVYINTSTGDVVLTPAALTDLEDGDKLKFVKATPDANKISFTDADGVTYDFVNRQSEFIKLEFEGGNWYVD